MERCCHDAISYSPYDSSFTFSPKMPRHTKTSGGRLQRRCAVLEMHPPPTIYPSLCARHSVRPLLQMSSCLRRSASSIQCPPRCLGSGGTPAYRRCVGKQARVDKAGKRSGRAGQRTYLKGVHDPEVQPGSGDPDLLRSGLAHRLNAPVGNLGHVIAEPAFVQADHAAAGGRDDALVVASS